MSLSKETCPPLVPTQTRKMSARNCEPDGITSPVPVVPENVVLRVFFSSGETHETKGEKKRLPPPDENMFFCFSPFKIRYLPGLDSTQK